VREEFIALDGPAINRLARSGALAWTKLDDQVSGRAVLPTATKAGRWHNVLGKLLRP
jgi:hypothetical protein